ncbi:extracellular solute-binding protein [Paenibacillus senegalensis]|uniref:extracellular solute-binding protein n=1 Tax=Paenibacillus senegalensis TaxID=1465766 RepID=UPI000289A2AB|nr:extracellular solute-binding protein [Paenibacillus senegalensis]
MNALNPSWKARTAALIASGLLAGLAAGCSGGGPTPSSPSSPPQGGDGEGTAAEEPVVLEWLAYDSYGQPDPSSPIVKLVEEKFNAKFNFWFIDANKWDDTLNVKLASGEMPDALKIRSRNNIANYASQGILEPLDMDLLREHMPTYMDYLDTSYPQLWDAVKYDGEVYAIPVTNKRGAYPTVVVWRQDWLNNVGITKVPETIEEFEEALYKFRNEDPDQNGARDTYGMSDFAIPMILGAYGFPPIDDVSAAAKSSPDRALLFTKKDGRLEFAAIQPEMKEALALLQRWYQEGLIDPEFITSENTTGYWANSQAFFNGRIGLTGKSQPVHWRNEMNPDTPDDRGGTVFEEFSKSAPDAEIVFGTPPVGPNGLSGTPQWDIYNGAIAITAEALKDPRKVETILSMMEEAASDYEYNMTLQFGIKGEDWDEVDGKFVSLRPSESNAEAAKYGRYVLHAQVQMDEFQERREPFTFYFAEKTAGFDGYTKLIVPSLDIFNRHATTLGKLTIETYFKIITGEVSIDAFDDYVEQFRSMGGDEVLEAMNEAYQRDMGGN